MVCQRATCSPSSPEKALGQRVEGGLLLTPEEVLFCHWYRHLPLPADGWFPTSLKDDTALLRRTIALDVLRNGGERVVPVVHLASRYDNLPPQRGRFVGNDKRHGLLIQATRKSGFNGRMTRLTGTNWGVGYRTCTTVDTCRVVRDR